MNIKRFFGTILTSLGIGGLIYWAILLTRTTGGIHDIKALVIYGILGLIFFASGIGLIRTTNDAS